MKYDPVKIAIRMSLGLVAVARQAENELMVIQPMERPNFAAMGYYDTPHGIDRIYCGQCGNTLRNGPGTACTFCQQCAGSHGPNDPCPAAPKPQPLFNLRGITTGRTLSGAPEETDNDHVLKINTWHCPDCNTDNDEDRFPIKCSICRRGRP